MTPQTLDLIPLTEKEAHQLIAGLDRLIEYTILQSEMSVSERVDYACELTSLKQRLIDLPEASS